MKNLIKMPLWLIALVLALSACGPEEEPKPDEPCAQRSFTEEELIEHNLDYIPVDFTGSIVQGDERSIDSIEIFICYFDRITNRTEKVSLLYNGELWTDVPLSLQIAPDTTDFIVKLKYNDSDSIRVFSESRFDSACIPFISHKIYMNGEFYSEYNSKDDLLLVQITR